MDLAAAHTLHGLFAGRGIAFVYSGSFPDEHTARLVDLGEQLAQHADNTRSLRNKLAFVLVEAYQNIVRHRAPLPAGMEAAGRSLMVLRSSGHSHEIIAMNPVRHSEQPKLEQLLAHLHKLDVEQLKELFLERLQGNSTSQRGGAGLGLIEMARRSGEKLWHRLDPLGSDLDLFSLRILLGPAQHLTDPAELTTLHQLVGRWDVRSVIVGMPAGMQGPVIDLMALDGMADLPPGDAYRMMHLAASEVLEAIQAPQAHAMTLVAGTAEGACFVLGGAMTEEQAGWLTGAVEQVNAMSQAEVSRAYRQALIGRAGTCPAMRGLLDLSRRRKGPIQILHRPGAELPVVLLGVPV